MISTSYSTNPEPEPTKKRKRLTGSQKKARKAAKLANSGFSNGRVPAAKGSKTRIEDNDEEEDEAGSKSPEYRPQSPEFVPQPEDADQEPPVQFALPTQPIPQPRTTSPQPQTQTSQPLAVKPSAAGRLPLTFPAPPPITPLTGSEPALDPETPESLLESALWSWYTAVRFPLLIDFAMLLIKRELIDLAESYRDIKRHYITPVSESQRSNRVRMGWKVRARNEEGNRRR